MEKEHQQQDSLATVAVKDYAPSEGGFSCEPPPAYQRPMKSTAVQVARIAAITLVLMSFILGAFILAAAWVQTSRACEFQLQLQDEVARQEDQANYQALVADPLQSEESAAHKKLTAADQHLDKEAAQQDQDDGGDASDGDDSSDEEDEPAHEQQLHFKLPLTLDFDDLAGSLVERNMRARMDCVVEKRRLDQTVAQPARELRLPFGLNISTAPRLEHHSGERLAISCETGRDQRHMPAAMEMVGPIVVPGAVPQPLHFNGPPPQPKPQVYVHHMRPQPQPQPEEQAAPLHILEALRVPIQVAEMQQQVPVEVQRVPIQITEVREFGEGARLPPQLVAEMRAAVQMAAAEAAAARRPHPQQPQAYSEAQRVAELRQQVAEARRAHLAEQAQQVPLQVVEAHQIPVHVADGQIIEAHHLPMQIVEEAQPEGRSMPVFGPQAIPIEARGTPMDGRPTPMEARSMAMEEMQTPFQKLVPPPPQQQAAPRPHYVHPRSVRSVDEVFHKRDKRMRRCACDCAC